MSVQTTRAESLIPALPLAQHDDADRSTRNAGIAETQGQFPGHLVYRVDEHLKNDMAVTILSGQQNIDALVYVKTNAAADALAEKLNRAGIVSESIHDNKAQRTKTRKLSNFQNKFTRVLVVTESVAATISIEVSMIINFDLPVSAETYRTRIHNHGKQLKKIVSFCDRSEVARLANIKRILPGEIEVLEQHIV